MIYFYKTPLWAQKIFPKYTWHGNRQEKIIHLTFDDGPIPEITEWVIEQLEQFEAKATFFCVGDNIRKYPHIAQQLIEKGHRIGNHTFNHIKGWQTEKEAYWDNIALCQDEIDKLVPQKNRLFRPPYGRITPNQGKMLLPHYKIVMWDVLTHDYDARLDANTSLQKVIKYTKNGSIVVFHDNLKAKKNLYEVLPRYLEHFSQLGFRFDVL